MFGHLKMKLRRGRKGLILFHEKFVKSNYQFSLHSIEKWEISAIPIFYVKSIWAESNVKLHFFGVDKTPQIDFT